jgi:hypothetical protein
MTAAELRFVVTQAGVLAGSPVVFVGPDGQPLAVGGWKVSAPPPDADGKPTGAPVVTLTLKGTPC